MSGKPVFITSILVIILLLNSCHTVRFFTWNFADVNDYKRFPATIIHPGKGHFAFARKANSFLKLPHSFLEDQQSFESFLNNNKTTAFLVIHQDTILYEKYFSDYNAASAFPSFSITKSVVSALLGIAISEGIISSLDDRVSKYLPKLSKNGFDRVTLRNLINMRSGIKFSEGYFNPFSEMAKFYYGKNLDKFVQKLRLNKEPGATYQYQSANTQILAMIIERTSGKSLPDYLQEKIWEKAGMQYDASWNLDSEKHGRVKAFCCLNARPLDFARFARLYCRDGNYQKEEIIPSSWISETFNNTTDSKDAAGYPYHFMWRVLDHDILFAKGILGQYIYIDRSKNLIIIRFGEKSKKVPWIDLFKEIGAGFDSQSK